MTEKELADLIAHMKAVGSDTDLCEAKACSRGLSKDVWESVSAFANTQGGTLVLGLAERSGFEPVPEFNAQRVLDQFVGGMGDASKDAVRMANPPRYHAEILTYRNAPLLVISIEENETAQKPCYIDARGMRAGSFKRIWDKDVVLSATELYELQNVLVRTESDKKVVAQMDDLDPRLIEDLLNRKEGSRALRGATTQEEKLIRLGVADKNGGVTLAGLLALGLYPQQYYPKLLVDVAVFAENEKGHPDAPRFVDRQLCEGALAEVVNTAVEAVARNLRRVSTVSGTGRREQLEIPREVLREAIANAVVHREYDDRFVGQAVSVDVYPNRIEVRNPGGLWGTRTKQNLAEGVSECRNDLLMSLIKDTPLHQGDEQVAEGNGTGIPLMIRGMKARALTPPEFEVGLDYVTVRLGRYGTEILENRAWLANKAPTELTRDKEALLLMARERYELTPQQAHEVMGIDSDEVRAALNDLANDGLLLSMGDDRYRLNLLDDERANAFEQLSAAERETYALLDRAQALDARELAERTGKSLRTIQRYLRRMVDLGLVKPTAQTSSRDRRYLLV